MGGYGVGDQAVVVAVEAEGLHRYDMGDAHFLPHALEVLDRTGARRWAAGVVGGGVALLVLGVEVGVGLDDSHLVPFLCVIVALPDAGAGSFLRTFDG